MSPRRARCLPCLHAVGRIVSPIVVRSESLIICVIRGRIRTEESVPFWLAYHHNRHCLRQRPILVLRAETKVNLSHAQSLQDAQINAAGGLHIHQDHLLGKGTPCPTRSSCTRHDFRPTLRIWTDRDTVTEGAPVDELLLTT